MRRITAQALLFWATTAVSAVTLLLVVANAAITSSNQTLQAEINERQQFINQSIQLSRVNEGLIRAIATAAASSKDNRLRDLLAQHGITFSVSSPAAAPTGGQR